MTRQSQNFSQYAGSDKASLLDAGQASIGSAAGCRRPAPCAKPKPKKACGCGRRRSSLIAILCGVCCCVVVSIALLGLLGGGGGGSLFGSSKLATCHPHGESICAHHDHAIRGAHEDHQAWITTWGVALSPPPQDVSPPQLATGFEDATLRQVVRVSTGGHRFRVRLSSTLDKEFEDGFPWRTLSAASIALQSADESIDASTLRTLTFNGGDSYAELGYDQTLVSDPVDLCIDDLANVSISLYFEDATGPLPYHSTHLKTGYLSEAGNHVSATTLPVAEQLTKLFLLSALEVDSALDSRAHHPLTIVTLGDSNTDGFQGLTTLPGKADLDASYPDFLANRLRGSGVGVVNKGITGNALLGNDGGKREFGESKLTRLARDVFSVTGVSHVVMAGLGGNDGAFGASIEQRVNGMKQLAAQLRAFKSDIVLVAGPVSPEGGHANEANERAIGLWDFYANFSAALESSTEPSTWNRTLNSGDSIHPTGQGSAEMANTVPLHEMGISHCPRVDALDEQNLQDFDDDDDTTGVH